MVHRLLFALLLLPLAATAAGGALASSGSAANAAEGRRISITGTVDSVAADHFTLKDLQRRIVVEMDGQPWSATRILAPGDRVAVSGRTVGDFAQTRRIRATTLMIPKLNYPGAPDDDWLALNGTVASIAGDSLTLDSGGRRVAIDASGLSGGAGTAPLRIGERVTVSGVVPDAFLARRHDLRAVTIARLDPAAAPAPAQ